MKTEFSEKEINDLYINVKNGIFNQIEDDDIAIAIAEAIVKSDLIGCVYDSISAKAFLVDYIQKVGDDSSEILDFFIGECIRRKIWNESGPIKNDLATAATLFDVRANNRKELLTVLGLREIATNEQIVYKVKELLNY